ncbi:MAG: ATP-binding protein [Actinomycetota bacterium]|nr:ATP-binding protein [Actinomycetota bacterium]
MVGEGINPFRYSGPVPPADLVGRGRELRKILDVAYSANNARLVAPRRYGKTSLLRATLAEAEAQGWLVVYVDFFGVLSLGDIAQRVEAAYASQLTGRLAQWFTALRRTFKPVVRVGGGPVPASIEVSASSGDDPLGQRLGLPRRLHERSGKRVLVAFDEFQDVLQAGNADSVMRSEIQHHGDAASYIFAGSHVGMMQQLFADKRRAFYAQAERLALPPLADDELGDFLTERFVDTGKDVGSALGPLLDIARGHPQRSMLLAHSLWQQTAPGAAANEEVWVAAWEQTTVDVRDEIKAVWASLSPTQRQVLNTIAENRTGLYSKSTGHTRGGSVPGAVASLVDLGEVIEAPEQTTGYRTVDPLLALWVRGGRGA